MASAAKYEALKPLSKAYSTSSIKDLHLQGGTRQQCTWPMENDGISICMHFVKPSYKKTNETHVQLIQVDEEKDLIERKTPELKDVLAVVVLLNHEDGPEDLNGKQMMLLFFSMPGFCRESRMHDASRHITKRIGALIAHLDARSTVLSEDGCIAFLIQSEHERRNRTCGQSLVENHETALRSRTSSVTRKHETRIRRSVQRAG